jgi:hypothetical protein
MAKNMSNTSSNQTRSQSISNISNQSSPLQYQPSLLQNQPNQYDPNNKYNPDIEQNYGVVENKRTNDTFIYSTNMWKPIIGSINKDKIIEDDFKIQIEKPDFEKIKSTYEIQIEQRQKEKELAEKLAKEYAIANNLNNPVMEEINKPIEVAQEDLSNLSNIDNTFIELKTYAQDMLKDTNNLDIETIRNSVLKLDDFLNSVKNL